MKPEIISEEPLTMVEVKAELEAEKSEEENVRVQKVKDYLDKFTTLSQSKAKDLEKKIEALKIGRLDKMHIRKLVDIVPTNPEDVKNVLKGYTITISQENAKKIAETIDSVLK